MCGIVAILNAKGDVRKKLLTASSKLRHRGPDASGIVVGDEYGIAHERLAIMDPASGAQPFVSPDGTILAVNGEIYNYKDFKYKTKTKSDCEVIMHLWEDNVRENKLLETLDGVYAFVIYNKNTGECFVTRDAIGVVPLYYGYGYDGSIAFASEMKALEGLVGTVKEFPPGAYYDGSTFCPSTQIFRMRTDGEISTKEYQREVLARLAEATRKRLMSDVEYGVLLSGGIDSSIIAAIATAATGKKLKTFCIGLEDSEDSVHATKMAKHIGSEHYSFHYTKEKGWDAIREVIYHLETFDVTTIRAGAPLFLLARRIRALGIKMVLSGEGSDELFGGYLYFHNASCREDFHDETVRKVQNLHRYDCLRANKAMAAFGVECRVPFLDRDFVNYVIGGIDPAAKMPKDGYEKWLLRDAYENVLPEEIAWRRKEQFSDGVGHGWIDFLKQKTDKECGHLMKRAKEFFPNATPKTSEAFYYRMIFDAMFKTPGAVHTVPYEDSCACSSGIAAKWKGNETHDASGRSITMD
jgi:asparagine synthase (glutamine-hydrolysing)